MHLAQEYAEAKQCALIQVAFDCCIRHFNGTYASPDLLQLALVVFLHHQLVQILYLHVLCYY